jgi:hypothetical protein
MSRVSWNFGDDPWWILGSGSDSFGVGGGLWVGMSAKGVDELDRGCLLFRRTCVPGQKQLCQSDETTGPVR